MLPTVDYVRNALSKNKLMQKTIVNEENEKKGLGKLIKFDGDL